jgi:hypothetical protein
MTIPLIHFKGKILVTKLFHKKKCGTKKQQQRYSSTQYTIESNIPDQI